MAPTPPTPVPTGARLLSLQTGRAASLTLDDGVYTSAVHKTPVPGRVAIGRLGAAGDEQADRKHHGGPEKALLVYAAAHLPAWAQQLGQPVGPGFFGENFTIDGHTELNVCLGDIYQIGTVRAQVSQPREPCATLSRFRGVTALDERARQSGRTGWYLRVLQEGEAGAGDAITLLERPNGGWTLARAIHIWYRQRDDIAAMRELAAVPYLSERWAERLARRIAEA